MKKRNYILNTLSILIACLLPCSMSAVEFLLRHEEGGSILELIPIQPSERDSWKMRRKGDAAATANEENCVFLVKLYAQLPIYKAEACYLYIGEEMIEEYGPFEKGVFFKIYSRKDLEKYLDKPLSYTFSGASFDLGITFPEVFGSIEVHGRTAPLPDLREALQN